MREQNSRRTRARRGNHLLAVLKTRRFGYDGKGKPSSATPADAEAAWGETRRAAADSKGSYRSTEPSVIAVRGRRR
ncbi:MAG: hypothetical protein U0871_21690 [Gemmataceae bacterium]